MSSIRLSAWRPTKNQISKCAEAHQAQCQHHGALDHFSKPLGFAEVASDQNDHLVWQSADLGDCPVPAFACLSLGGRTRRILAKSPIGKWLPRPAICVEHARVQRIDIAGQRAAADQPEDRDLRPAGVSVA
jgi:hypothetical protein